MHARRAYSVYQGGLTCLVQEAGMGISSTLGNATKITVLIVDASCIYSGVRQSEGASESRGC